MAFHSFAPGSSCSTDGGLTDIDWKPQRMRCGWVKRIALSPFLLWAWMKRIWTSCNRFRCAGLAVENAALSRAVPVAVQLDALSVALSIPGTEVPLVNPAGPDGWASV